ncbi:MAG: Rossmann-like and DUF2520 domain-containing protein [Coriobacteriia bacterium]
MTSHSRHPADLPAPLVGRSVAILGAGKVGRAVGQLLRRAGLPIAAVTARSAESALAAARSIGGETAALTDNAAAARLADIVLITANDDAIASVVAEVARGGAFRPGQLVAHMSGALPLAVLAPAAVAGALVGCAHPLQAFATAKDAAEKIPGSVFGVTAGPGAEELLGALVAVLGGEAVPVADDAKATYHAAAVMASNYLVAVEDLAVQTLMASGFDEASALRALQPLIDGTVANVRAHGTTLALTGPIVRGDVDTVRSHISTLAELPGDALSLYRALGLHALEIAIRRGTLTPDAIAALREALSG